MLPSQERTLTSEERLVARARDFEIPALLYVLGWHGYSVDDMSFRGHMSLGPQPSMVHALRFYDDDGRRRVEITLNLGLVSCRSPLPSYFSEYLHHYDTAEALRQLVQFIDQGLLSERCQAYRPERTRSEWPRAKADLLSLAGMRSLGRMHSFFRHIFPELDVMVDRSVGSARVRVGGLRLGHGTLGDCAFGTYAQAPNQGLHVTLRTRALHSYAGVPWFQEAMQRMRELVLPYLWRADMYLWVELVLAGAKYLELDPESSFGYEPMPGGPAGPFRLTLYRGHLKPQDVEEVSATSD